MAKINRQPGVDLSNITVHHRQCFAIMTNHEKCIALYCHTRQINAAILCFTASDLASNIQVNPLLISIRHRLPMKSGSRINVLQLRLIIGCSQIGYCVYHQQRTHKSSSGLIPLKPTIPTFAFVTEMGRYLQSHRPYSLHRILPIQVIREFLQNFLQQRSLPQHNQSRWSWSLDRHHRKASPSGHRGD